MTLPKLESYGKNAREYRLKDSNSQKSNKEKVVAKICKNISRRLMNHFQSLRTLTLQLQKFYLTVTSKTVEYQPKGQKDQKTRKWSFCNNI
jgi:hypothetical protein